MTKNMKKRKWHDSNFTTVYEHAKSGLDDEAIADKLEVPLHTLRRWMRTNDALDAMIRFTRDTAPAPAEVAFKDEEESGDELTAIYHEFSHLKPPMKKALLVCYAQTGVISHAARAAGTSRENHYRWLREDPEYKELFERLEPLTVGRLEDKALHHAMNGMRRYKFNHAGRPLMVECPEGHPDAKRRESEEGEVWYVRHYYEDEYSAGLQIFMLKCWKPNKYRDKPIELNQNIAVGFDLNKVLEQAERANVVSVDAVEAMALEVIKEHEDK